MRGERAEGQNPPAFPCVGYGPAGDSYMQEGMTLRDWFAGQALVGLAGKVRPQREEAINNRMAEADWEASLAYRLADAMLAARGSDERE